MDSVNASFAFDTREVRRMARTFGADSERWLMDDLTKGFIEAGKIAEHEANILIKGGESSKLAQAAKQTVKVSGIDIEVVVDWDDAQSDDGFPYAASVDRGRKAFGPIKAKALRFEVGGETVFARWVKEAPAQDFTGRGTVAAEPKMRREIQAAADRWADRMEAAL